MAVDLKTLFRTSTKMTSNFTEWDYITRIFLARYSTVVSEFETSIDVRKVGLEQFLFHLSQDNP